MTVLFRNCLFVTTAVMTSCCAAHSSRIYPFEDHSIDPYGNVSWIGPYPQKATITNERKMDSSKYLGAALLRMSELEGEAFLALTIKTSVTALNERKPHIVVDRIRETYQARYKRHDSDSLSKTDQYILVSAKYALAITHYLLSNPDWKYILPRGWNSAGISAIVRECDTRTQFSSNEMYAVSSAEYLELNMGPTRELLSELQVCEPQIPGIQLLRARSWKMGGSEAVPNMSKVKSISLAVNKRWPNYV